MATWFDRDRGIAQGRIEVSGGCAFILGAIEIDEQANLSDGDYTEISQSVDLTGIDFVSASFVTIGKVPSDYQPPSGFSLHPNTLFEFDFDVGVPDAGNRVVGGFPLAAIGSIETSHEDYSPDCTYCKRIPVGIGSGHMAGLNNPQFYPATLDAYTLQWWMNFDSDAYSVATGVYCVIFDGHAIGIGEGGIMVRLSPIAGLHEWNLEVVHSYGATFDSAIFSGYTFDAPQGWHLYTIRYDNALAASERLQLWVDDALADSFTGAISPAAQLPLNGNVQIASPFLVGLIDQIRLLSVRLDDLEVEDSFYECVSLRTAIEHKWMMRILIDGTVYAEREIHPQESRTWTDFVAPARLLSGMHTVAFRLSFEVR